MLATLRYAMKVYRTDRAAWNALALRGMQQDFSWESSAREYEKLYTMITDRPSGCR